MMKNFTNGCLLIGFVIYTTGIGFNTDYSAWHKLELFGFAVIMALLVFGIVNPKGE